MQVEEEGEISDGTLKVELSLALETPLSISMLFLFLITHKNLKKHSLSNSVFIFMDEQNSVKTKITDLYKQFIGD